MPRYFFNIQHGEEFPDRDGFDLPDIEAAKNIAVRTASALIADHGTRIFLGDEWAMEVTNEKGLSLFTLTFYASLSPVLKPH